MREEYKQEKKLHRIYLNIYVLNYIIMFYIKMLLVIVRERNFLQGQIAHFPTI